MYNHIKADSRLSFHGENFVLWWEIAFFFFYFTGLWDSECRKQFYHRANYGRLCKAISLQTRRRILGEFCRWRVVCPTPWLASLGLFATLLLYVYSTFFLWFSLQLAITPACFPHLINELNKTCIRCLFCIRMRVMIFIFLFHFFFKKLSLNSVLFARLLFFNSLIFLILVVCAHGGKRTTCRHESVLCPPWASWRLNSGSQAWQHVPSPVESSH